MSNNTCYYPDGTTAYEFSPCNVNAEVSQCCYSNSYCLSNQLCFDQNNLVIYRGTCSSSVWSKAVCGDTCIKYDNKTQGILPCIDYVESNGKINWVCWGENCTDESLHFKVLPGPVILNAALASDLSLSTSAASVPPSQTELGFRLGLGLGFPLLVAVAGCVYFWNRQRRTEETGNHRQKLEDSSHSWPLPNNANASHASNPDSEMYIVKPPNQTSRMHNSRVHVPELGDTGLGGRT